MQNRTTQNKSPGVPAFQRRQGLFASGGADILLQRVIAGAGCHEIDWITAYKNLHRGGRVSGDRGIEISEQQLQSPGVEPAASQPASRIGREALAW